MHISIKGNVGKQEILECISTALNTMEDAGVDDFRGVNFYFNPCVLGETVVPQVNQKGFSFHFESTKKHIEHSVDVDGNKQLTYKKGVITDLALDEIIALAGPVELPTKESIDKEEADRIAALKEQHRLAEIKHNEHLREKRERERRDREIEAKCCERFRQYLGLTRDEFKVQKSSTGWITTAKGIQKYSQDIVEPRVFRVSMKIQDQKQKQVYLLSEQATILYQGVH